MASKKDKKIIDDTVINFFSGKKEYRSLSNFWEKDVIIEDNIDKRTYESGEHCFHGEKYIRLGRLSTDKQRKKELIFYGLHFKKPSKYKTCNEAKKMGGKNGLVLSPSELEMWHILSVEVQINISMYKYETYDEVKEDIKNSGNKLLVHPALRTSEEKLMTRTWEGKAVIKDGKVTIIGVNRLGNIWMDLREFYK
jgi:predicted NAD-dependent protein-ADP-ribosyltransferase YbiA (DUF1768 family)